MERLRPSELPEPIADLMADIEGKLMPELSAHGVRFVNRAAFESKILSRIRDVKERGVGRFLDLATIHNELCVALSVLELQERSLVRRLQYEPSREEGDSRLDFCIDTEDNRRCWMEVKTIHPMPQDDGALLRRLTQRGRFPLNVSVGYLGNISGELFHGSYAARRKMLEYTIETEQRIASLKIDPRLEACFLVFCGTGFDWSKDELEDFVGFYENSRHRLDDPYRGMELHFMAEKGIALDHTLTKFGYLRRPKCSLRGDDLIWVSPPMEFS